MSMIQVNTGFGYLVLNGNIVTKVQLNPGSYTNPVPNSSYVEVANKSALDAIVIYVPPLTPAEAFNVSIFVQELMVAFQADANVLPYYAVLKDLASYQNFYGMNILVNGLLAAGKFTSAEVTAINTVLENQGIVLSTFTTPPS